MENKKDNAKNDAVDRAGIGQSDQEKGIAPPEVQKKKKEQLIAEGKAKKKPVVNREPEDDFPIQLED